MFFFVLSTFTIVDDKLVNSVIDDSICLELNLENFIKLFN